MTLVHLATYNDTQLLNSTTTLFDIICYCLILSRLPSDLTKWVWFGECLECYFTLLSPGRGLHSSPFNLVGVCVQVGRCRPDTVNSHRLHHWWGLWNVHTGVWPPARAWTSMIHSRNIPWQPEWFCCWDSVPAHQSRARAFSWMHCVCYVHQPFFQY